jgi:predicted DsbA family dithiol-disulfide isomerase
VRLAKLESDYDGKIELEWRSYLLQPAPKPKPLDRFMAYTQRWVMPGGPGDQAPECGFRPWAADDDPPPTHSLPAAIAGKVAQSYGRSEFDRFHLAAMRAYFVEHRTISDPDVLADIAGEVRLPRDEFRARLAADAGTLAQTVLAEHRGAIDAEVHAVPSVVIGGFPIPGAQDLDVYRRVIDRRFARMELEPEGPEPLDVEPEDTP